METHTVQTISKEEARERIAQVLQIVVHEITSSKVVKVSFVAGEQTTIYNVEVSPERKGHLIGAQGRNILALRGIVSAMAYNYGLRAVIELVL